jgi:hypothetical protein
MLSATGILSEAIKDQFNSGKYIGLLPGFL